jgi:DNA-binding Xre family transcriptional regulator
MVAGLRPDSPSLSALRLTSPAFRATGGHTICAMKSPDHKETAFLSGIADNIKAQRARLDLSIRDAAAIAGIPQSAWWSLENRGNPTAITLYRLAVALQCAPSDLIPRP